MYRDLLEAEGARGDVNASVSLRRIVRNSAFNLTGQGIYALFHLLAIVVLARALGAERFGQYYTIFALILVVQLIAEGGLSTILTSRLVRSPTDRRNIVAEAASLLLVVCMISIILLVLVGLVWSRWQGDPAMRAAFAAAGLACAAIQVQRFCAGVLQASERFGFENVARVSQGAVFAGLVLVWAKPGRAVLAEVLLMLAASHFVGATLLLACLYRRRSLSWPSPRPQWRSWLSEGTPLGFGDVVRGFTWQLDTILLGFLQPPSIVGIYSVAYRPLGPLNWLPRAILSATFPSLTRLADDRAGLEKAFSLSTRVLMIVSLPIAIVIFFCAEPFVLLLAGREYLEAVVPLRILIWITILSFLSMHFRFLLAALGKQQTYARLVLSVFLLETVVEAALIPKWGYLGACAGSLLGELVFAVAGLVVCRQSGVRGLPASVLARAVLAGAAMAAVLWLAQGTSWPLLALLGLMATGIYFGVCVWLGALGQQEVRQFFLALGSLFRPASRPA